MYADQEFLLHMGDDIVAQRHGVRAPEFGQSRSRQAIDEGLAKGRAIGAAAAKSAPATWIRRLVAAVARRHRRRAAIRSLESLNDYQLKDIGLGRADIPSIVAKGRKRKNGAR